MYTCNYNGPQDCRSTVGVFSNNSTTQCGWRAVTYDKTVLQDRNTAVDHVTKELKLNG